MSTEPLTTAQLSAFNFTEVPVDDLQNGFLTIQRELLTRGSVLGNFNTPTAPMGPAAFFYEVDKLPSLVFNKLRDADHVLLDPEQFGVRPNI